VDAEGAFWWEQLNAQWDDAQAPTGLTTSASLDGVNDKITVPDHDDLDLGASDLTMEGWIRSSNLTGQHNFMVKLPNIATISGFGFDTEGTSLKVYVTSTGTSWDITSNSGKTLGTVTLDTWHHFELDRSGSDWYGFIDGVQGVTWSSAATILANTSALSIGANLDDTLDFAGWLAGIRVTRGVARHTSNFTPPSLPLLTS
jgi:hypothetical protein